MLYYIARIFLKHIKNMDTATIAILLQLITIIGSVVFWFAYLRKDIELIKKDVWKIEWIEKYIENLSNYLNDGEFKRIPDRLKQYKSTCSNYYTANSPLKLNEKWIELVKNSGFDSIVKENNKSFINKIKKKVKWVDSDKIFYYIEKESIDLLQDLGKDDDDLLEEVWLFIFKNGLLDEKKSILNALGLYLRDEVINNLGLTEKFQKLFVDNK